MPRAINFRQLDAFLAVILNSSVTQAAAMLNISQPAVSRLIHDLEEHIDIRLFERTKGRLHPTPDADQLFQELERTYGGLDRIVDFIEDLRQLKSGQFCLAATTPTGQSIVPIALKEFQKQHPDVKVSYKIMFRREVSDWVDAQQFDLAVATFPIDYPSAASEVFARTQGVCVMLKGHALAKKKSINAKDLAGVPFVNFISETMARYRTDLAFEQAGIHRNLVMETQTSYAICQLVAQGIGVSVVDPFTASSFKNQGLVVRPFRPVIDYAFGLLFPVRRPVSRLAERFAAIVRSCAKDALKQHVNP